MFPWDGHRKGICQQSQKGKQTRKPNNVHDNITPQREKKVWCIDRDGFVFKLSILNTVWIWLKFEKDT